MNSVLLVFELFANLSSSLSLSQSSNTESSSEQLKLFYLVLGQFRTLFQLQVHAKTLQTYDINTKV